MKSASLSKVLLVFLFFMIATGAEAAEKVRIGVMRFESKAEDVSDLQAEIITDLFTRELAQSRTIKVYEREQLEHIGKEQRLGMSGLIDINTAVEVGRLVGLQYILLGSVTELSQKVSGGAVLVIGSATHEAKATINLRVIDVTTSEVVLALSETGHSTNTTSALVLGDYGGFVESEFGDIKARAIADAVVRLGHSLRARTTGETSHIVGITGEGYAIDVSAKEGSLYLVYIDGKSIVDMNGNVLGRDKIPLAVLKVRDAGHGHSIAVLADGCRGDLIQRGDKIEPIARDKSKQLLDRKAFAKDRPSQYSDTFDQLFGKKEIVETTPPIAEQPSGAPSPSQQTSTPPPVNKSGSAPYIVSSNLDKHADDTQPIATPPAKQPQAVPVRAVEGFDPNTSTDSKVIDTYSISSVERNTLGIKHRGAYNLYRKGQYKKAFEVFVTLVDDYRGNYLSAYWAGVCATKLRSHKEAAKWYDIALSINPNYVPATEARAKVKL